ncbi:DUF4298 domain-containing protein [Weeksellaceae bacterium KMM 9713]|uniref:DUF4298 domain-containing protein n=1 Tax=Profundicola chukchiensis TaxID=2961959 RepID=A0A9X4RWZ8_9FLAO|nr:DUF4298 domain-containing protein [Profundicola chukchiensis]MDG4945179.1 DUF4298 domain-containing protein [Profundicola chukchiensis]MDG4950254.1 DUF4298 domain-containing protein [Profundicola chukchiensis]
MSQELDKSIANAKEMNLKLEQAEKDLAYMEEFLERFPEIKENIKALEKYYFDTREWMQDRERILEEDPDYRLGILSEDGVFNVHVGIYQAVKQMIKEGALYITE